MQQGTVFGDYQIVSLLGSGGMGDVYLVDNTRLGRREALKVISGHGIDDPAYRDRFIAEARTAASLEHPSVVVINDLGIAPDGSPWFTMPHLHGHDLQTGRYTDTDLIRIARQIGDALDFAHSRGIVHRDVKPANIFQLKDENDGTARDTVLLDLGISQAVGDRSADSGFVGTLAYSAPELVDGRPASPASDQYALACTLYQLCTGRPPFAHAQPATVMLGHLRRQAPPLTDVHPSLAAFDAALRGALAKNPAQRYPNCRALSDAVTHALAPSIR
ncbi:hypothetical protein nbrc107696_18280 [Gordonia spumicola]|uniref:non-specific serine/threonine protein kinase n=1 Tax=Gordonia spumicola TaxID=589161 RepID=A0A7I9V846_9ACTN|nr:serine/threonine-protein kinase [Gordonia spumicola]GEE01382.1 hypothetical protein nbrc107696_18280 [Gordonia spumicola]